MEWILILVLVGDSPAMTSISGFSTRAECAAVGEQWKQTKVSLDREYHCLVGREKPDVK